MFESEVNIVQENASLIPDEILEQFSKTSDRVLQKTLLPWTEHCVECVWPTCYSTCSLYDRRIDGKCRRFEKGMIRIPFGKTISGYLIKITFKKWAKLLAQGTLAMESHKAIAAAERSDLLKSKFLRKLYVPLPGIEHIYRKRYSTKNKHAQRSHKLKKGQPDSFLAEIYNPLNEIVPVTLTIRPEGGHSKLPFQDLFHASPGYNRFVVNYDKIIAKTHVENNFKIELTPNEINKQIQLVFGIIDFVIWKEAKQNQKTPRVKCVIWDLDNTLWQGTLIEQGEEKLQIRSEVVKVVRQLDKRGVLQSIASKNNESEALRILKKNKLTDYFLLPQINWEPKSQSIRTIVNSLNIGMDTILFIDDQEFEREEVNNTFPEIMTHDGKDISKILSLPELNFKVTKDGRHRRLLYQNELARKETKKSFHGDYLDFLKSCDIKLRLSSLEEDNLERVKELVQRTNQMNFSGNIYSEEELRTYMNDFDHETYVMDCSDKFGNYGIIGFGIFNKHDYCLKDLMFSCRIQSKRIEHAFLTYLLEKYHSEAEKIYAVYHRTEKNQPSGKVFDEFGFIQETQGADNLLSHSHEKKIPNDKIAEIIT